MYTSDYAKTQSDYRREELSRTWGAAHHTRPRLLDRVRHGR